MTRRSLSLLLAAILLALTGCATTATHSASPQADPQRIESPADLPEATTGQVQAATAAASYVDMMPMSAKAVRDQLRFDKHERPDIEWAMKHLEVDWNDEAIEAAHLYLDTSPGMSRAGLADQLRFDGFTWPESEHGAALAWKTR